MLATRWPRLFRDDDWAYELKWDGVRTLLTLDDARTMLRSRAGHDVTATYPELSTFDSTQPLVLDGEVVALDKGGRPSFGRLQRRMNVSSPGPDLLAEVPVAYVVFDVLYADREGIEQPWLERREILEGLEFSEYGIVPEVVRGDPGALWDFVAERDLEGIVAKRVDSPYRPGVRSPDWRKISRFLQARAVVGGFLPGEGGRADTFGSLLLGMWTDEGLRWVGAVGSGFDDESLVAIKQALDEMTMERSPFLPDPGLPRSAIYVYPALVALVQYKEFTRVGRLRAPSFKGFTDDEPHAITWEEEGPEGSG